MSVRITADSADVNLLNRLIPPARGERFGAGRHVEIPDDWESRILAGERVPGCRYFELQDGHVEFPSVMATTVRAALRAQQRPEDQTRAEQLLIRIDAVRPESGETPTR